MADILSIRLTKEVQADAIEKAAERLDMNKNQLILEGIKMMCTWDKTFFDKMQDYAVGLRISMAEVMQNLLIKRLAQNAAKKEIWGPATSFLSEFLITDEGLMTGEQLFNYLYEEEVEAEAKEFIKVLNETKLQYNIPLDEHEQEVMDKYGR